MDTFSVSQLGNRLKFACNMLLCLILAQYSTNIILEVYFTDDLNTEISYSLLITLLDIVTCTFSPPVDEDSLYGKHSHTQEHTALMNPNLG